MDPKLTEALACPICKGPLAIKADNEGELFCLACSLAFSVKGGIPDMIAHNARKISEDEAGALRKQLRPEPSTAAR